MDTVKSNYDFEKLKYECLGEIYTDALHTAIYATDASNYQIIPCAVVLPKNINDVRCVLEFCNQNKLSITARGGGTSLVGQTVGDGVILDFTKYMNSMTELNVTERYAWVEPGIVRDDLNDLLKIHRLHFAPDPATSSRATVGGMIANNSSGTRSILYGKTLDHVIELEIVLISGEIIQCSNLSMDEITHKCELQNKEGEIYRTLMQIIYSNRSEIEAVFPKVMRRVGGYNLDEFLGSEFNLSKLIIGSEGTLGMITRAKLNLEILPKEQVVCVVHFNDFFESISYVKDIVQFKPAAVELLDDMLIQLSRSNIDTMRYCDFIQGDPGGALVVEFFGDDSESAFAKADKLKLYLVENNIGYAHPIFTEQKDIDAIFTVRKKGLGLLLGVKGRRKPIAIIEDAAVPLEFLPEYIKEVFEVCRANDTPVVAYAHASVGLLHVKPLLDLRDHDDIERMKKIAALTLALVKKYKGSWSGEHGDGLARSPYNEEFFGTHIYNLFIKVKTVFDPQHLLNPGKIVMAPPIDQNLRYGVKYQDRSFASMFHYRDVGGFHDAVHLCNGVGECRKSTGGTMCPSFRATKNEKDSTRGRANILRLVMSNQMNTADLTDVSIVEAMDLCISCKACKSECPSNVDMSKLKAEVSHLQHQKKAIGIKEKLILNQRKIAQLSYYIPFINTMLSTKLFRSVMQKIAGLDARRILPKYDLKFKKFIAQHNKTNAANRIVLFADTYLLYHESKLGISAYNLLTSLSYEVEIYDRNCCQRPAMSKGLLTHAKKHGLALMNDMYNYAVDQIPVLVIEPSCLSAMTDDLIDLMDDDKYNICRDNIFLLEDFLVRQNKRIKFQNKSFVFHGHCHHKALFATKSLHQLMEGNDFTELNSGCCGMAGSFGYEQEHYDISKQIGELSVLDQLKTYDDSKTIITSGFSCKHQIKDLTKHKSNHWLEYVDHEN